MRDKKLLILMVMAICVLLVSCSRTSVNSIAKTSEDFNNSTGNSQPPSTGTVEPPDLPITVDDKSVDFIMPIEGLRPVAVMIDNQGVICLPQGGLDKAQIIYEIIVEGGLTRLMPVFWGTNPEMIGSVRSARHYFLDYVMEHDAIYVHFGWSPKTIEDIRDFKINNINGVSNGGGIFWDLTKDKGNWQDSYTSMEKVKDYIKKVRYKTDTGNKPVFKYNPIDSELAGGSKAEEVNISYSKAYSCVYVYDSPSKAYMRFKEGRPQMERVTGKQLAAKNIVIQFVKNYTIKGDDAGRQEVNTVGSGNGMYITNGKVVKMKWSKASRSLPTKYNDESGNAITLNPGQTWIQVVPLTGKVKVE